MINILLIGGGAREHAIAKAIKRERLQTHLTYCAPTCNPGIDPIADYFFSAAVTDIKSIIAFTKTRPFDFAIIGPEAPLALGLVDQLAAINVPCIGPTQALARIETSKGFTRDLMRDHHIDGLLRFQRFSKYNPDAILKTINQFNQQYVVKEDGLCGGKGVKVQGEHLHTLEETLQFCESIHGPFVIEEKCSGPEFSLISFCDGNHIAHCPVVQDHKRAYENDEGPNTGGMGSYSVENHLLPFLTSADVEQAQAINTAVFKALQSQCNTPYIGFLYGGFMLTRSGVKVIEYNARLGDPEAINLLALLETDFVSVCQHMIAGTLDKIDLQFKRQATVVKYIVPNGYPDDPQKAPIYVAPTVDNASIFYGAVTTVNNQLFMTGSRAIAALGVDDHLFEAENKVQKTIEHIKGPIFYRKDIGTPSLIDRYVRLSNDIRI